MVDFKKKLEEAVERAVKNTIMNTPIARGISTAKNIV